GLARMDTAGLRNDSESSGSGTGRGARREAGLGRLAGLTSPRGVELPGRVGGSDFSARFSGQNAGAGQVWTGSTRDPIAEPDLPAFLSVFLLAAMAGCAATKLINFSGKRFNRIGLFCVLTLLSTWKQNQRIRSAKLIWSLKCSRCFGIATPILRA